MSYGPDLNALWHRGAYYVDKILKGAKPADLPVEQPTKFELIVDGKTAAAFGITLPLSLLAAAHTGYRIAPPIRSHTPL